MLYDVDSYAIDNYSNDHSQPLIVMIVLSVHDHHNNHTHIGHNIMMPYYPFAAMKPVVCWWLVSKKDNEAVSSNSKKQKTKKKDEKNGMKCMNKR
jgi:hypothetical protein